MSAQPKPIDNNDDDDDGEHLWPVTTGPLSFSPTAIGCRAVFTTHFTSPFSFSFSSSCISPNSQYRPAHPTGLDFLTNKVPGSIFISLI